MTPDQRNQLSEARAKHWVYVHVMPRHAGCPADLEACRVIRELEALEEAERTAQVPQEASSP